MNCIRCVKPLIGPRVLFLEFRRSEFLRMDPQIARLCAQLFPGHFCVRFDGNGELADITRFAVRRCTVTGELDREQINLLHDRPMRVPTQLDAALIYPRAAVA